MPKLPDTDAEPLIKKTVSLPLSLIAKVEHFFKGIGQPVNWHRFLLHCVEEKVERVLKKK